MGISFQMRVSVPSDVMIQEVGGEAVLLNLKSEQYFGLDGTGTAMWRSLTTKDCIQSAYEALLDEFDARPDQLRQDLSELVQKLVANGLVEVAGPAGAARLAPSGSTQQGGGEGAKVPATFCQ